MSYSSSGAVATLRSPSNYRMPVATGRHSTSSHRLSSSSVSDRPYYSSSLGTYTGSSLYSSSTRSSTLHSSYTRNSLDTSSSSTSTATSRFLNRERDRDRENKDENTSSTSSYLSRPLKSNNDLTSTLDSPSSSYKLSSRYLGSSTTTPSSTSSSFVSRRYTTTGTGSLSSPSPSRVSSEVTPTVDSEHRLSVDELRRLFDPGVVLSVHNLNNPITTNTTSSSASSSSSGSPSSRASPDVTNTNATEESPDQEEEDEPQTASVVVLEERKKRGSTPVRFADGSDPSSSSPRLSSSKAIEKEGMNGLRNIGNTCFMNSVIQCLSNTKPLLEYLIKNDYLNDINTTISGMKGALIKAFASLVQELWTPNTEDRVVNTSAFKNQIQRFAPRFMGYSQQDAQEFLRYLLEGLHEDVNRVTAKPKPITTDIDDSLSDNQKANEAWKRYLRIDDSKIMDSFVGQLKSTLQCTVCGHCSVTFDPFWDLSLPVPSRTNSLRLQTCLDAFTKEEVLDGDEKPTCSRCETRRKCTKTFSIQKFPKILVLHLKRFSPTEKFRGKLSNTVEFPLTGLDMSAYAAGRGQGCTYNLYAISNHSGTTYSGHYTAYCKHPYSGSWHEYNDSRVSPISSRSLVSGEAYVLFYELTSQTSHL